MKKNSSCNLDSCFMCRLSMKEWHPAISSHRKNFIAKKGEGIHHIAFEVTDIQAEMKRLQGEGFVLLNETPKEGADNKLVCFLHPKGTNGVLIELCQER